jgi:hypothetical protein
MYQPPQVSVEEYGVRAVKPKTVRDFNEQLRDTHKTGVAMGAAGPVVLLGAFFSSSAVLITRGLRSAVGWIDRKIRSGRS